MNSELVLPFHFEQSVNLAAPPGVVFDYADDFAHFGEHMMRSSWMMAGSRMRHEFDGAGGKAIGAKVRLVGSILGAPLEIEEYVIERIAPLSKAWETAGNPRMLILSAYRMGFEITPQATGCRLRVFIDYAFPPKGDGLWAGRIAGGWYARWCVRSIAVGAVKRFGPVGSHSSEHSSKPIQRSTSA